MMKATRKKTMSPRHQKFQNWKQNTKRLVFHWLRSKLIRLKWKYHHLNDSTVFYLESLPKYYLSPDFYSLFEHHDLTLPWSWKFLVKLFISVRKIQIQLDINKLQFQTARCRMLAVKKQHRCWWRMLETKCVGDNFKMLVMVLTISVTNILYLLTLASGTNIQKMSPRSQCHQHV